MLPRFSYQSTENVNPDDLWHPWSACSLLLLSCIESIIDNSCQRAVPLWSLNSPTAPHTAKSARHVIDQHDAQQQMANNRWSVRTSKQRSRDKWNTFIYFQFHQQQFEHFSNDFSHPHKKKGDYQGGHMAGRAMIEEIHLSMRRSNDPLVNEMKERKSKERKEKMNIIDGNNYDATYAVLCL